MKNHIGVILFFALCIATIIMPQESNQSTWKKIKSFTSRNKGKIVALGLAAVAIGVGAVAASMIKDKADAAITKAGVKKIYYDTTLMLLMTVGLLPEETGIKFMTLYFTKSELAMMWEYNAIKALAYYWDDTPAILYGKLVKDLTVQEAEAIKREVNDQIDAGMKKLKAAWQKLSE